MPIRWNDTPTNKLLSHFCRLVSWTGIYPYTFCPQTGSVKIRRSGPFTLWAKFTAVYLIWYTSSQYALVANSIVHGRDVILIVIQTSWVYGTSSATTALLHRHLERNALQDLTRAWIELHRQYLEPKLGHLRRWKRDIILFAGASLFFGWISSAIGICVFFFTFPDYPQHMYGYTLAENESVDRLSVKCIMFAVYETFMMVPDWGNRFMTFVHHHAMHAGLAHSLRAASYEEYRQSAHSIEQHEDEDVFRQHLEAALALSMKIRQFYRRYNEACALFHCIFMTFAMFVSWSCLYATLAFYAHLNPLVTLIFVVNIFSTVAYMMSHKNQASVEVRMCTFLAEWDEGVGAGGLRNPEEVKYYKRRLRSHPPVYYAYAGICRMEPSTVLIMLHHLTNHVIVFLKGFNS